jgi:hypothetical protein
VRPKETGLKLLALMMLLLALWGCAQPPQLTTSLEVQKSSDGLVLVKLKVTNLEDRVTVPIALDLTGQARMNDQWSKPDTLLHPAAFVLNRKEQREITKLWRVQTDAVRTTLVLKEQETGRILKSDKAEKNFTSPR